MYGVMAVREAISKRLGPIKFPRELIEYVENSENSQVSSSTATEASRGRVKTN